MKNLHLENNIFKIGDSIIKLKNKDISIKIDAEGHEYEVLQGLKKLISYNRIFLQIEIFDKNFKWVQWKNESRGYSDQNIYCWKRKWL